ncbi:hypothetical protein [Clostridium tetani]|uniref:Uncharacterized protein n=1 Tax=Clostridium tetani TaxID=1513 RepID=A0ABY0ES84_CLOTA|nr:hypothetical protein [Clostridium tetani]CDI49073.1 hypothetical protein BN906_01065 [Clostridium tetani 12124569]KHO39623.1 hypothetical protein OR62_05035 [Clostridium tetani]RXI38622.1 hypothetical protein DP129_10355 [Clostridium tetani]RXI55428.1 hypothetical protein DP131_08500 [Clostridium tetani]RXI68499.1 hypothetical protein DQN76_09540 [Clostridium tetani]
MKENRIKACMIGESIFRVGDYTSLAQGWGIYKGVISLEECVNFKIKDMYFEEFEDGQLPRFIAVVETNKNKTVNVNIEDLKDIRCNVENRKELEKIGYDFQKGAIYCKGYEDLDGQWKFFNIGLQGLEKTLCMA